MRNFGLQWPHSGFFSPKIGHLIPIFEKRAEETPSSYVPKSGRIKFKDKSSDIFMEFLYLLFWVKLVYPTMVFKNFQVGDVQRTGKEKVNDMNRVTNQQAEMVNST